MSIYDDGAIAALIAERHRQAQHARLASDLRWERRRSRGEPSNHRRAGSWRWVTTTTACVVAVVASLAAAAIT